MTKKEAKIKHAFLDSWDSEVDSTVPCRSVSLDHFLKAAFMS